MAEQEPVSAREKLAEQDWARTTSTALSSVATERGWVLGLVLMFVSFIVASTYGITTLVKEWVVMERESNKDLVDVLNKYSDIFDQNIRRLQESNRSCADTIARMGDRQSRSVREQGMLEKAGKQK